MDALTDTLSNPYALTIIIALSIISTVYCYMGMRQKQPITFLMGVGIGIPSFDVRDWKMWGAGILVMAIAFFLRRFVDSP